MAPSAHAADPVKTAIKRAHTSHQITKSQRDNYTRLWNRSSTGASAMQKRGKTSRATEIRNVRSLTVNLARRGKLSGDRLPAIMANVNATTYVFTRQAFPQRNQRIRIPSDTVIFAYYPGYGMQFQPLFTFTQANEYYHSKQTRNLELLMRRMLQLSVQRGTFTTWEYYFPYGGAAFPWVSGMAQGVALQVLHRTATRTGDNRYNRTADEALEGFRRTSSQQGFMSYQSGGKWYLLYGFQPKQRVLNGHLQALIGLHSYWKATNSLTAKGYFDQGVNGVKPILPKFDTGAWSNYVPGQEATIGYHDLMITQLDKLGRLTGDPVFADYAHRFATYRKTPPKISPLGPDFVTMYPHARDGFRDSLRTRFFVDKRATVVVRFKNRANTTVRTFRVSGHRGGYGIEWDLRHGTTGRTVAPGVYTMHFTAIDVLGNRRNVQMAQPIIVERDRQVPSVSSVQVRRISATRTMVVVNASDAHSAWVTGRVVSSTGKTLGTDQSGGTLRIAVARSTKVVERGKLFVEDSSGNRLTIRL